MTAIDQNWLTLYGQAAVQKLVKIVSENMNERAQNVLKAGYQTGFMLKIPKSPKEKAELSSKTEGGRALKVSVDSVLAYRMACLQKQLFEEASQVAVPIEAGVMTADELPLMALMLRALDQRRKPFTVNGTKVQYETEATSIILSEFMQKAGLEP